MENGFKGDRNKAIHKCGSLYISLMLLGQEVAELGPQARSHNSKWNARLYHRIIHLEIGYDLPLEISSSVVLSSTLLGESRKIMWLLWSEDHEIVIEIIPCLSGWLWIIMSKINVKHSASAECILSAKSEWILIIYLYKQIYYFGSEVEIFCFSHIYLICF